VNTKRRLIPYVNYPNTRGLQERKELFSFRECVWMSRELRTARL
jgi:hypothetical protein